MKQTQTQDTALKALEQFQTLSEMELKEVIGGDGRGTWLKNRLFGGK